MWNSSTELKAGWLVQLVTLQLIIAPLYWGQNENLIMQNLIIHQYWAVGASKASSAGLILHRNVFFLKT